MNGSVGTTIVAFIQTTVIVTAESSVGKTGLDTTLLLQVVDSGPARLGLVVIFLGERMHLRIERQMLQERHLMQGSSHGCFECYSRSGIDSMLSKQLGISVNGFQSSGLPVKEAGCSLCYEGFELVRLKSEACHDGLLPHQS